MKKKDFEKTHLCFTVIAVPQKTGLGFSDLVITGVDTPMMRVFLCLPYGGTHWGILIDSPFPVRRFANPMLYCLQILASLKAVNYKLTGEDIMDIQSTMNAIRAFNKINHIDNTTNTFAEDETNELVNIQGKLERDLITLPSRNIHDALFKMDIVETVSKDCELSGHIEDLFRVAYAEIKQFLPQIENASGLNTDASKPSTIVEGENNFPSQIKGEVA